MGINWSNILYPENEKKREKVLRLSNELLILLQQYCDAANLHIEAVERHLPGKNFSKVSIAKDKTITSNCDVIKERLHEIEEYLEQHGLEAKCRMSSEIFEKLHSIDLSFLDKLDVVKKVITGSMNFGFSASVLYQIGTIGTGMAMTSFAASFGTFSACSFGIGIVTIIYLGIGLTIGAIIGTVERNQLDTALSEYKQAIDTFKPATDKLYDNISEVMVIFESLSEQN